MTKCEQGLGPCVLLTRDELTAYKALTIQDRAAMVDPLERAEIERQCLDAFVDDLAAALEKREAQSAHVREASGVSAALALVKVRLRIWTGTRK